MSRGPYRKLDALEGRAPKLYVTPLERVDTDREIRSAVRYCKSDNYLAVAFGVDERRVARIRAEQPPERDYDYYNFKGVRIDGDGPGGDNARLESVKMGTTALHAAIMQMYRRRATNDNTTVEQAAFAMGMRP